MKTLKFYLFLIISLTACKKEFSHKNISESIINDKTSNQKTSLNVEIWEGNFSKTEFLSTLSTVHDTANISLADSIYYLIVKKGDTFLEYLAIDDKKNFYKISQRTISTDYSKATLKFKSTGNLLSLNGQIIERLQLSAIPNDFILHDELISGLCCKACYVVHDILDIHSLDCLCCLMSCGYSCGDIPIISFE